MHLHELEDRVERNDTKPFNCTLLLLLEKIINDPLSKSGSMHVEKQILGDGASGR